MLLDHELSVPWRETKFERAVNFAGALKGLFLHVEMIQPRRSAGRWRNDAQPPDPSFTTAQYDRLALIYTIASVRAGRWLVPAFHAAIDAHIRNGHDDPLNFDVQSFANSLDALIASCKSPRRRGPKPSRKVTAMRHRRPILRRSSQKVSRRHPSTAAAIVKPEAPAQRSAETGARRAKPRPNSCRLPQAQPEPK